MSYCDYSNQESYPFELPVLPFEKDAFLPHFSVETMDYHYGKHHNAYVNNLNNMLKENRDYINMSLEQIIKNSFEKNHAIFNNAAQIWNHTFFWHSIKPGGGGKPSGKISEAIDKDFGSYEKFAEEFKKFAMGQFGSGWVWLVYNPANDHLEIVKTANAVTPIVKDYYPLMTCDVWEHAYYIDYRNKRLDYAESFLSNMVNWDFAEMNFNRARQ